MSTLVTLPLKPKRFTKKKNISILIFIAILEKGQVIDYWKQIRTALARVDTMNGQKNDR